MSPTDCQGLQFPLVDPTKQLVIGAAGLPLERFLPLGKNVDLRPKFIQLVEAFEPESGPIEPALGGDPLLPHNIDIIAWPITQRGPDERCNARVEDRLRLIVNNHFYSEHSLQPAYTAATFFLFKNAVVRDRVALSHGRTTLNFAANVQRIDVWISTPKLNAWLTLGGCMLLALGLLAAVTKPYWTQSPDPFEVISHPHVIARVLVNEVQFPPMLLDRHVVRDPSDATTECHVDNCTIRALSIQTLDECENDKVNDASML